MDFFGFGEQDFIPCEICGGRCNDVHHIEARGMGGSEEKDTIDNLMGLCRRHHNKYGDKKQYKPWLLQYHRDYIKKFTEGKLESIL
jgi:hypothetical protein